MVSRIPRALLTLGVLTLYLAFLLSVTGEVIDWGRFACSRPLLAWGMGSILLGMVLWMATPDDAPLRVSEPEPEAWLCKHCLKPYVPGAHFCPRCACPQTFFSGTATYERAYALTWCLGRAAHHPTHVIHPLGIVLNALYIWLALLWIGIRSWVRHVRGLPPPCPAIEYGTTPYWTYDAQWALPEFEEEPDENEATSPAPADPR